MSEDMQALKKLKRRIYIYIYKAVEISIMFVLQFI